MTSGGVQDVFYILKIEAIGFADGLEEGYETEEKGVKDVLKGFGLSNRKGGGSFSEMGKTMSGIGLGKNLVLDVFSLRCLLDVMSP